MPQAIGVDLGSDERTIYTINGVSYPVRPTFYLASCDKCGWIGSSEECGVDSGDDSDVYCPSCGSSGADCGKISEQADDAERLAKRKQD